MNKPATPGGMPPGARNAGAKAGRPRPRHVVEAMREGRAGKPQADEARARMSAAHKARGTLVPGTVPWTAGEDEKVRSLPAREAAEATGRTLGAAYDRRRRLGLADGRERSLRP